MSTSDTKDVRNEFLKIAVSYRRRTAILGVIASAFVAGLWCIAARLPQHTSLFIIGLLIFAAFAILSARFTPKLICPACSKSAEGEVVRFCPECGHAPLEE